MNQRERTAFANAKINLSLDLTGILPDGYHAIRTVMQSVALADAVTVRQEGPGLSLSCSAPGIPADERNIAWKAAAAFCDAAGISPCFHIHIEKRIPSEAGMAGGSADAAAVLRLLNEMEGRPLDEAALLQLALSLGADVPFCLTGGTRLCMNKGEVMADLPPFSAHVLIAKPDRGVSTAAAFRRFDSAEALSHPDNDAFLFHMARGDAHAAFRFAGNLFEQLTDVPEAAQIKQGMLDNGAYYAAMSGSGSAFFGLFQTAEAAAAAGRALAGTVPFVRVSTTANRGIELQRA